jgi:RNA-directed DNA polymerase
MGKLALAASHLDNLFRAWRDVRAQVRRTSWPQISAQLGSIEAAPLRALRAIQRRLRSGTYQFSPKWGYAKRKSGGSRRGITVQGVEDRIVQRTLLNVMYTRDPALKAQLGEVPDLFARPTSFAGSPGRGVPEAIALAVRCLRDGARAFALSDVKDFFPCVPRGKVVEFLRQTIDDSEFIDLFESALETELLNRPEIERWLNLFPLTEVGVAQGSLLSVFVGNLALRHFDTRLNRVPLTTIRYLDDFLVLGPSLEAVRAGFAEGQKELAEFGMSCYEPGDDSHKAFEGLIADGFDFLGCRIHPDGVSPSRRGRRKLLGEIASAIADGKAQMRRFAEHPSPRESEQAYAQTLARIDKKIRGWGDAHRFVTNRLPFAQIDREIDAMLNDFRHWFARLHAEVDAPTKRRISGVALLGDTPPKPLSSGS